MPIPVPEEKKSPRPRQLLTVFLTLYLALTLLPGGAYALSLIGHDDTTVPSSPAATPSPAPDKTSSANAATQSNQTAPPAFLDESTPPTTQSAEVPTTGESSSFHIYDTATQQLLTVSEEDFLPAALACEMDLSAPVEALKAQAVAIYTNYVRERRNGTKEHGGDFACDTANWITYVPVEAMQARWGEEFEQNYRLLQEICTQVIGQLVTSNGAPALTSYFAISAGSTERAENVWEGAEPYLQAVACPGDLLTDGYLSTKTMSAEEFASAASAAFPNLSLSGAPENWLTDITRTPSGYVKTAVLGGQEVTGPQLRTAFSLRSACFELGWDNGSAVFTVQGWGHGVGMSQAGAVFQAQCGADYREILSFFYPGTQLLDRNGTPISADES